MAHPQRADYCALVGARGVLSVKRLDAAMAAGIAVLFGAEIVAESDFAGHRPLSLALAIAFCATLAVRRRLPLVSLVAALALIEISNAVDRPLANAGAFMFGIVLALYSCGRYARGRAALASGVLMLVGIPLAAIEPGQPFSPGDLPFFIVFFGGPWITGRVIRHRQERERSLVGRAAELEVERDAKARDAVIEERARIARELHDVVAHAISVIVLQARGGRRMLEDDPEDTRDALDAIEHAGEQALAEMRRLLGMLRRSDEQIGLAPAPRVKQIDELVAQVTATGLPVDVTVEGEPFELPPGIDVSAYRIVQEALTNALKHAGPARAHVILRYRPNDLEIEVLDDGPGTGNGGGSGNGIVGIRERVAVYGGELESGGRPEGGYAVRARLPLGSAR
jgi:signal transduction histidine kinase